MSKVIIKMSFKNPNFTRAREYNVAHLNYIATRPGVDKSITAADLQKELSGESTNEDYLKYINERPRSHGLFDAQGLADIENIKKEIAHNTGFVYRVILSIREEDALKLGYNNKEKWQDLIREKMPDVAYKMRIKLDNLRWVAAIHMEKGHPHAHLMIWEKDPEKIVGVIGKKNMQEIRKIFTDEIFHEEKLIYIQEKNSMRDLIRDLTKGDMEKIGQLIKEVNDVEYDVKILTIDESNAKLPSRMPLEVEKELISRVRALSSILPGKGRINYEFMPENVKNEVSNIADYMLNLDQYKPAVYTYLRAVENNAKLYTGHEESIKKSIDNAYQDLQKRVSQIILKAAVEIQNMEEGHKQVYFSSSSLNDYQMTASIIYKLWKSISNHIDFLNKKEDLLAHKQMQYLARKAGLENKAARKEMARKLKSSGLYKDVDKEL